MKEEKSCGRVPSDVPRNPEAVRRMAVDERIAVRIPADHHREVDHVAFFVISHQIPRLKFRDGPEGVPLARAGDRLDRPRGKNGRPSAAEHEILQNPGIRPSGRPFTPGHVPRPLAPGAKSPGPKDLGDEVGAVAAFAVVVVVHGVIAPAIATSGGRSAVMEGVGHGPDRPGGHPDFLDPLALGRWHIRWTGLPDEAGVLVQRVREGIVLDGPLASRSLQPVVMPDAQPEEGRPTATSQMMVAVGL